MKKTILSLAMLILAGGAMAQTDKAAAKAAAKALKEAKKEAKTQMDEALKIKDAIYLKVQDKEKPATAEEVFTECKKGLDLINKALASGHIEEKKLGEGYKICSELANLPHNLYIEAASKKQPLDTANYYLNLKLLTDAMHNELKYTEKKTGETGNEKYLQGKQDNLAKSVVYYIYAAQFESDCKRYVTALEAYDIALNYGNRYPVVANQINLGVESSQIAYYAFHAAHDAKMYKEMDKYYDLAITFEQGAKHTEQVRLMSYQEQGDTLTWATKVREICLKDPAANEDYIQILSAYYQKKNPEDMGKFADEILANNPDIYIANYARAFVYFQAAKYDDALKYYKKCTEIKPDDYNSWYQCGLCKYRQAYDLNSTISNIKNQVEAKKTKEKTIALFGEAIPYFEKAREVSPNEPQNCAYELRTCYSAVGKAAEAAEMDKLL